MAQHIHNQNKQFINRLCTALYDCDPNTLQSQLSELFTADCEIHLAYPLGDYTGPSQLFEQAYQPLLDAIPDLERRDFIVMAGEAGGRNWVGCAGNYIGVFARPWLDIPPTQRLVYMRYHEFFALEDGQIVEMQAIWDIPQLMMQANAWPMSPSLGTELFVPGPATRDGIITTPYDQEQADFSLNLVMDMIMAMIKYPLSGGVEVMELEKFWHPKMMWYGPAGIGSMRRISGFRHWHQEPFLKAMPNRKASSQTITGHMFGDGNYVGVTGWPNLHCTISGDGWLGIPPANQEITMCSLDFWRQENGLIRENWVLLDMLNIYRQLGVDVLERMRELTVARQPGKLLKARKM